MTGSGQRGAEFLADRRQFAQPKAEAALILVDQQGQPAHLGDLSPDRPVDPGRVAAQRADAAEAGSGRRDCADAVADHPDAVG